MFLLGKWITWAKSCKELSSGFKHVEWDIHLNFWLGVLLVQSMPLSKLLFELLGECATAIFLEEDDFRKS